VLRAAGDARNERSRTTEEISKPKIVHTERKDIEAQIAAAFCDGDKPSRDTISDALDHIPNDIDYEIGLRIGFSLYHGLGDGGRDLWERWSARSSQKMTLAPGAQWPIFVSGNRSLSARFCGRRSGNGWQRHRRAGGLPAPDWSQSKFLMNIVTEDSAAVQFVELRSLDLRYLPYIRFVVSVDGHDVGERQNGYCIHWARELARNSPKTKTSAKRYITNKKLRFSGGVERFAKK